MNTFIPPLDGVHPGCPCPVGQRQIKKCGVLGGCNVQKKFYTGTVVKMKWGRSWRRGKIMALSKPENTMDMKDIPLAQLG